MSHRVISIDSEEPLTSLFEKVSLALEILRERFVSLEASIASQKCEENELVVIFYTHFIFCLLF